MLLALPFLPPIHHHVVEDSHQEGAQQQQKRDMHNNLQVQRRAAWASQGTLAVLRCYSDCALLETKVDSFPESLKTYLTAMGELKKEGAGVEQRVEM